MKVIIVSDIHGNYFNMKKVIEDNPSFDRLILLGDILSGPDTFGYHPQQLADLLNIFSDKIVYVRGNCDRSYMNLLSFYMDLDYLLLSIDKKMFFITHGHLYSPNSIPSIDFDVFLSGHTHIALMEKREEKLFLNPGSITLPRGGCPKSYIIYEDGVFSLIDLTTNTILKKIK